MEGDGRGTQDGGDTCTPMADSYSCLTKTITILESNYPSVKKKKNVLNKSASHFSTALYGHKALLYTLSHSILSLKTLPSFPSLFIDMETEVQRS